MNKRLLVLTGMLSVLSVNVMGAPVNVGTDTITIGSMSSNNRFEMAQQIKDLQADNASLRADNEELRSEIKEIKAALQKLQ